MNGFYETHRDEMQEIHYNRSKDHTYPSHFHRNIELFILLKGHYALTINGERYEMVDGSVAFIDCYDTHSYEKLGEVADDSVVIIPSAMAARFNAERSNKSPRTPLVHSPTLAQRMIRIIDDYIVDEKNEAIVASAAELLLSVLIGEMIFSDETGSGEGLLVRKILNYVGEHYRERITRDAISRTLGYSPEHISRIFHKYLSRSINDYVNSLRLEYVEYMRKQESPPTLTELIYQAGFGSEQTYYRAKRKAKGADA